MALARVVCCSRSLLKESSKAAFCAISHPVWTEGCVGAKRHLLSEDVIKLQDFQQRKLAVAHLVTGSNGNYIEFFRQKLQGNELVLRDELKLLLHLCQSAEDMVIARDAMFRYHSENHNLAPGDFKFGPVFMRLCYELGLEGFAAATLKDTKLKGFFNDPTSFNIAIDMLFTKGQYEAALEVLRVMRSQGVPFNKDTLTLAFGTCYKLNNKESYKICSSLIDDVQSKGHFMPRHAYCFAVALALRQNDTENAQALYLQIMSTDSRLCQNLRVAILAMAGGVSEALSVLSAAIVPKGPSFVRRPEFSQELVDLLRLRCEGQPSMENLESVVTRLVRTDQLTQETLDDMLCRTPSGKRRPVIEERKTSRRTLRLLQSSLLTE